MAGFKIADMEAAKREWAKPGGIIEIVPLSRGELQPVYQRMDFGKLD